jgi:argininosuccinate lyase
MAAKAGAFWSTTSHLADELVRRYDLSFRDAHQVVGRFVRDAIAAGQTPASVDATLLVRAAREAGHPEAMLDTADVQRALDATNFLHTRASEGSVNPRHVREHVEHVRHAVDAHAQRHAEAHRRVAAALDALDARARALAGASRR